MRIAFPIYPVRISWHGRVNYLASLVYLIKKYSTFIEPVLLVSPLYDLTELPHELHNLPRVCTLYLEPSSVWFKVSKFLEFLLGYNLLLASWLNSKNINVLSHGPALGKNSSVKSFPWIPDLQHKSLPYMFSSLTKFKRDLLYKRYSLEGSCVFFSSFHSRNQFAKYFGFEPPRSAVIPFVCRDSTAIPFVEKSLLLSKYKLPDFYFHIPNQFWKHKNHQLLATSLLQCKYRSNIFFVLTGKTSDPRHSTYFNDFSSFLASNNIINNFLVLGEIPYAEMLSIMRFSRAVINPSLYEGWSTTVEEAKSMNKTLLLSDIEVHREQDPPNSIYFSASSPCELASLIDSFFENSKTNKHSQALSDRSYSWIDSAKAFVNSYESAVSLYT